MYKNKLFSLPTKIYFEDGIIDSLKDILKEENFNKALLISTPFFVRNGMAEKIKKENDIIVDVFSDFTPSPTLSEIENAANKLKEIDADCVIALGGGTCIDLAKFASAYVKVDGKIQDYFFGRKKLNGHLPLIAIPTTSGTGSEVTSVSACTDDETLIKAPVNDKNFFPHIAIVDPLLTLSVPAYTTAITGMDALAHALEAYWGTPHREISDLFATAAIKAIFENLEDAYLDAKGENVRARREMSKGSLYAGIAFSQTRTAAVHGCSYPLSGNFGLDHGEACAFTLDLFVLENAKVDKRMDVLAKEVFFKCWRNGRKN